MLFVVFVFLAFLSSLEARPSRARNATIVLHIGPHKTGSTHVQRSLGVFNNKLKAAGYCYQENHPKTKHHHSLACQYIKEGCSFKPDEKFDLAFFTNCLKSGKKLFISSETFSLLHLEGIQELQRTFPGQNVHVIASYREPLSLFYSIYTESTKKSDKAMHFTEFALQNFENLTPRLNCSVVQRYARVFGKDHVTLLDYYGMAAAKADIFRVIVCEIMGILCSEIDATPLGHENSKPDMVPFGVFNIVKTYAHAHGCKLSNTLNGEKALETIATYEVMSAKVPLVEVPLGMFRELARRIDSDVRGLFSDVMLYPNQTASLAAIDAFKVEEVDNTAFMINGTLNLWLAGEVKRLMNEKLLVKCKLTSTRSVGPVPNH